MRKSISKRNRKGLLKRKNKNRKISDMGKTSGREIRGVKRKATGRTAIGTLITKGAIAVKRGTKKLVGKIRDKRYKKLSSKIREEGVGMSKKKKRLIERRRKI